MRVPQFALWRGLLECGARYGEFTSTQWADLDVERGLLTLRAEHTKNGRLRVVPLRREYIEQLLDLKAIHALVLSRALTPSDRIFLTPAGKPWPADSKNLLRIFGRLIRRAAIPKRDAQNQVIDVHSLRHTCATRLARAGVAITVAARILGHSSIQLTHRFYVHTEAADLHAAVERVNALTPAGRRCAS